MAAESELVAMREAIVLAAHVDFEPGVNPRVGCVIISPDGAVLGRGAHEGPGTAHAEVIALKEAGRDAAGATAVVTLEPCAHTGRTPPCVDALQQAGVRRVVYAQSDPNPIAAGGSAVLEAAGVSVEGGLLADDAAALNREWLIAVGRGWPFVTLKVAGTLDGRVAASDGSSRWITSPQAREDAHAIRSYVGAVLVGTGTAISDDPELTDRRDSARYQPRAVVMGMREIPTGSRLAARDPLLLRTHEVDEVLAGLYAADIRNVLVEGGPTVSAAFLRAHRVDRVVWYLSPKLLGEGHSAVESLGISSVNDAMTFDVLDVNRIGPDIRIDLGIASSNRG